MPSFAVSPLHLLALAGVACLIHQSGRMVVGGWRSLKQPWGDEPFFRHHRRFAAIALAVSLLTGGLIVWGLTSGDETASSTARAGGIGMLIGWTVPMALRAVLKRMRRK